MSELETNRKVMPFENGLEETLAYMSWLDMFLRAYRKMQEAGGEEWAKTHEPEERQKLRAFLDEIVYRQQISAGLPFDAEDGLGITFLAAAFDLHGFAFFCLLLAAAPSMDIRYADVYRSLRKDGKEHGCPTFELAQELYGLYASDEEFQEARKSANRVTGCFLFDVYSDADDASELADRFTINRQAVAILKGDYSLQGLLKDVCTEYVPGDELPLLIAGQELKEQLIRWKSAGGRKNDLLHLIGAKGSGRKFLLAHCGDQLETSILYVDWQKFLGVSSEKSRTLLKEILVRCQVLSCQLVFCDVEINETMIEGLELVLQNCFEILQKVVITSEKAENSNLLAERYDYMQVAIPRLKVKERQEIWNYYGRDCLIAEEGMLDEFAATYQFTPGKAALSIRQAQMIASARGHERISRDDLKEAVFQFNSSKIAELASHIEVKYTWDDLEIAPEQRQTMKLACNRIKLYGKINEEWGFEEKITYGKGLSVLLYGPPGTGKTMAAQIMAGEIGMELYRVDLSQVVDKYIGETEKNIGRIFECAKEGNFILFFDEADSMFSKRTEVQNSNDKHANTEISYLLQKVEEYDGIVFLATNRYNNFDDAFLRRLTYIIRLEQPDAATRLRLFQSILPAQTPVSKDLDLKFFADNFELTGSNIKNILYTAAFMAAEENTGIGNKHIVKALKYEHEKQRKMLMAADLGNYFMYLQ